MHILRLQFRPGIKRLLGLGMAFSQVLLGLGFLALRLSGNASGPSLSEHQGQALCTALQRP